MPTVYSVLHASSFMRCKRGRGITFLDYEPELAFVLSRPAFQTPRGEFQAVTSRRRIGSAAVQGAIRWQEQTHLWRRLLTEDFEC